MTEPAPTAGDRRLAAVCEKCPLCRTARRKQRGLAFWFVRKVEHRLCPACRAYERVHGRKAHQPLPPNEERRND